MSNLPANPFLALGNRTGQASRGLIGGVFESRRQVAMHAAMSEIDYQHATRLADHMHGLSRAGAYEDHTMGLERIRAEGKQARKTIGAKADADVSVIGARSTARTTEQREAGRQERKTYKLKDRLVNGQQAAAPAAPQAPSGGSLGMPTPPKPSNPASGGKAPLKWVHADPPEASKTTTRTLQSRMKPRPRTKGPQAGSGTLPTFKPPTP